MTFRRGDVILGFYPFSSGEGVKRRPLLIVQDDRDNIRMSNTIVAQITSNLDRSAEPTHLLIRVASLEGQRSGLLHDSVISCNNLATIAESRIDRAIGRLDPLLMTQVDACLKAALALS